MNYQNKSLLVGIISVISIIGLFIGIDFLKGKNILKSDRIFYVYYDNVSGLTEGSSIMLRGYKVGTVTNIEIDNDNTKLKVQLSIEEKFDIPLNSVAKIVSQDLMGTKGVNLVLGNDNQIVKSGSVLVGDVESTLQDEVNAQILPLKNKTEQLIGSIDSVMTVITTVLNKDARSSLTKSLVSLDNTFTTLSETMLIVDDIVRDNEKNVKSILVNLSDITNKLNNGEGSLSKLLNDKSLYNDLNTMVQNIVEANDEIKGIIDNVSNISDDISKKDITATLNQIDKITKELELLLLDIKHNPQRYLNFSIIGNNKPYVEPKSK